MANSLTIIDGKALTYNNAAILTSGSGDATWGDIGGELSNQLDLKAALDSKLTMPESEADDVVLTYHSGHVLGEDPSIEWQYNMKPAYSSPDGGIYEDPGFTVPLSSSVRGTALDLHTGDIYESLELLGTIGGVYLQRESEDDYYQDAVGNTVQLQPGKLYYTVTGHALKLFTYDEDRDSELVLSSDLTNVVVAYRDNYLEYGEDIAQWSLDPDFDSTLTLVPKSLYVDVFTSKLYRTFYDEDDEVIRAVLLQGQTFDGDVVVVINDEDEPELRFGQLSSSSYVREFCIDVDEYSDVVYVTDSKTGVTLLGHVNEDKHWALNIDDEYGMGVILSISKPLLDVYQVGVEGNYGLPTVAPVFVTTSYQPVALSLVLSTTSTVINNVNDKMLYVCSKADMGDEDLYTSIQPLNVVASKSRTLVRQYDEESGLYKFYYINDEEFLHPVKVYVGETIRLRVTSDDDEVYCFATVERDEESEELFLRPQSCGEASYCYRAFDEDSETRYTWYLDPSHVIKCSPTTKYCYDLHSKQCFIRTTDEIYDDAVWRLPGVVFGYLGSEEDRTHIYRDEEHTSSIYSWEQVSAYPSEIPTLVYDKATSRLWGKDPVENSERFILINTPVVYCDHVEQDGEAGGYILFADAEGSVRLTFIPVDCGEYLPYVYEISTGDVYGPVDSEFTRLTNNGGNKETLRIANLGELYSQAVIDTTDGSRMSLSDGYDDSEGIFDRETILTSNAVSFTNNSSSSSASLNYSASDAGVLELENYYDTVLITGSKVVLNATEANSDINGFVFVTGVIGSDTEQYYMLVPVPKQQDEGKVLKVVNGTPTWASA